MLIRLRRFWIAAFLGLLAVTGVTAQSFPSAAGRVQDLDFVSDQLPAMHPDFFTVVTREQYQEAVSTLRAKVSTATDAEFYVGISKLIAMGGDAHTGLGYGSPFRFLPLRFEWFGDGLFVTRSSATYASVRGARLIRIGNTPIDQAVEQLATIIPHENEYRLHYSLPSYVNNQTILQGLGLAPGGAPTPLTFQTLGGSEITLQVDVSSAALGSLLTESGGPLPLYQQNSSLYYWYVYLPEARTLYFRYNACREMADRPFASFAADLLATLDANPVDTFIFDVRSNGGGNSALAAPVFDGLAARFSRLAANPKFRVYDVFDGGTFSSALMNAEDLLSTHLHPIPGSGSRVNLSARTVSIGQPTGGKPAHFGNVTAFTLPGSGISGNRSTTHFAAFLGIPEGVSLFPSISVERRSTDYFARFDPVMARILGRSVGAPPAPSGDVITLNAASFRTDQGIVPASYVSAFGAFGAPPDAVKVGGITAVVVYSGEWQVNFIVPSSAPLGRATVTMLRAGQPVASGEFTISRSGPGVFVNNVAEPSQPGAILNQDWTLNTHSNPASAGSIVQIFGTGYSSLPVSAYMAEKPAEIIYSGAHALYPGLWQINARVPADVSGQVPLFVLCDGQTSNGVTLWVQ